MLCIYVGIEIVLTEDLFLVINEDDSRRFNICALIADLPAGGLACDQVVVIEAESDTAGKLIFIHEHHSKVLVMQLKTWIISLDLLQ